MAVVEEDGRASSSPLAFSISETASAATSQLHGTTLQSPAANLRSSASSIVRQKGEQLGANSRFGDGDGGYFDRWLAPVSSERALRAGEPAFGFKHELEMKRRAALRSQMASSPARHSEWLNASAVSRSHDILPANHARMGARKGASPSKGLASSERAWLTGARGSYRIIDKTSGEDDEHQAEGVLETQRKVRVSFAA